MAVSIQTQVMKYKEADLVIFRIRIVEQDDW